MPAQTESRFSLQYGWAYGENGWNTGMDANMTRLGSFGVHLSVLDRDLTAPPEAPAIGATYIVAPGGSDAWVGKDGQVALWGGAGWGFGVPRVGWVAYIEDEEVLSVFKAGGWSAGVAM